MFDVTIMFLTFAGTIVIVGTVSVWLLIPTVVVILLFYYMRVIYISTSRAVIRMEGTSKFYVNMNKKIRYFNFIMWENKGCEVTDRRCAK